MKASAQTHSQIQTLLQMSTATKWVVQFTKANYCITRCQYETLSHDARKQQTTHIIRTLNSHDVAQTVRLNYESDAACESTDTAGVHVNLRRVAKLCSRSVRPFTANDTTYIQMNPNSKLGFPVPPQSPRSMLQQPCVSERFRSETPPAAWPPPLSAYSG